jgi:hypothetical protein
MPLKLCLSTANTLTYPQGGHLWVFINWALGFKSCGCEVAWLDCVPTTLQETEIAANYQNLREALGPFGLDDTLAVDFLSREDCTERLLKTGIPTLEHYVPFDILVDLRYDLPERLLEYASRTALINIDPGLYELALNGGAFPEPKHDTLFSIGERHGQVNNKNFLHTRPCVFLDEWPFVSSPSDSPWTTVAHWWSPDYYEDSKRESFRDFMTIPLQVEARFELALNLEHEAEQKRIESYGFKVSEAHKMVHSPLDFRSFIQSSAGEFSCAKPSYVRNRTAWVSDRTVCYLASGKPCVVQNTGESHYLPSNRGMHRFCDLSGAVEAIRAVTANYDSETRAARSLAEEFFDAHKVCSSLLSHAL